VWDTSNDYFNNARGDNSRLYPDEEMFRGGNMEAADMFRGPGDFCLSTRGAGSSSFMALQIMERERELAEREAATMFARRSMEADNMMMNSRRPVRGYDDDLFDNYGRQAQGSYDLALRRESQLRRELQLQMELEREEKARRQLEAQQLEARQLVAQQLVEQELRIRAEMLEAVNRTMRLEQERKEREQLRLEMEEAMRRRSVMEERRGRGAGRRFDMDTSLEDDRSARALLMERMLRERGGERNAGPAARLSELGPRLEQEEESEEPLPPVLDDAIGEGGNGRRHARDFDPEALSLRKLMVDVS
jgi:hypothetical protein